MQQVRLAVDVMGGDRGPSEIIKGILEARQQCPGEFTARLFGSMARIEEVLSGFGASAVLENGEFSVENCEQTAGADDAPSTAWKVKPRSSIVRCIAAQKEGAADVSLSAGDTGILLATAIFLLGRRHNVSRPALAAFVPTGQKRFALLLDVGANLECRAQHLVSFGLMGHEYMSRMIQESVPRTALLNVGAESTKGTKTILEAGQQLRERCPGYIGFIEGSDVLAGKADVIVCDGFVGNVLLKALESFHRLAESVLGNSKEFAESIRKEMAILNPDNYGAVPLLGIKGTVFKAHGRSSSQAIAVALRRAITAARKRAALG